MQKQIQKCGLKGIHRVTLASTSEARAKRMHARLKALDARMGRFTSSARKGEAFKRISDDFIRLLRAFNAAYGYKTMILENITCDDGRTRIAKAMSGNIATTDEIKVNYGALGTSATAPTTSDTQLGTETYRKLLASLTYSGKSFYGTAFYAAGQGTGTLQEHGLYIEGSATVNSGELLSRLLLGGIVKGAPDTLTIETEIQINDA